MKSVPMDELKKELASVVAEAEAGLEILITRHNKPVARLSRPESRHLHHGARFGRAALKPAARARTAGRYLQILQDDRGTDRG